MADTDIGSTTTTNLDTNIEDFSVSTKQLDSVEDIKENTWDNPYWTQYNGYYRTIPELKKAVDALAIWTVGKGYQADASVETVINKLTGWGEDSFQSILENMIVVKKINGDAFAEIIRNSETGTLINLKPLNPSRMRIVVGQDGIITRYEQLDRFRKSINKTFQTTDILHLCNDRIGDEIHGVSVVEACQWVIDARNEAMTDKRRVHHRSTIRVIEVDEDNTSKLTILRQQYETAIKSGEVLLVPKGNTSFPDAKITYLDTQEWIRYLEGFFYQAVGIPRVIASSENFTEAASKVGYLTFEPIYTREQKLLENDLFNQLAIKIKFNRPASLSNTMQEDEQKNTVQTGFQPNDVEAGVGE